ncbi:MAG: translation initiation factor IF-3 [Patescibacteria group bacterium]
MAEAQFPVNDQVLADPVHLIMEDGRSAGAVSLDQAKYLAHQASLDLVEISPRANPPVAKLLDYNKFRYQQEKQARQSAAKNPQLKEMRLSFSINPHDLETKARRARQFLSEGHFVRAFINLRGRENAFPEKAKQRLVSFMSTIDGALEKDVTHVGKKVQLIIKPRKQN